MSDARIIANDRYLEYWHYDKMWERFQLVCDRYDHNITRDEYEGIVRDLIEDHPVLAQQNQHETDNSDTTASQGRDIIDSSDSDTIDPEPDNTIEYQIFAKTPEEGRTIVLDVTKDDTIGDIKAMVENQTSVHYSHFYVTYRGKVSEDSN
eukprot:15656822-Heterocapsa_arctica.AAC.1